MHAELNYGKQIPKHIYRPHAAINFSRALITPDSKRCLIKFLNGLNSGGVRPREVQEPGGVSKDGERTWWYSEGCIS